MSLIIYQASLGFFTWRSQDCMSSQRRQIPNSACFVLVKANDVAMPGDSVEDTTQREWINRSVSRLGCYCKQCHTTFVDFFGIPPAFLHGNTANMNTYFTFPLFSCKRQYAIYMLYICSELCLFNLTTYLSSI